MTGRTTSSPGPGGRPATSAWPSPGWPCCCWQYDGTKSASPDKLSSGTCFVTCGIMVRLPFCTRPVCLPALARLVLPGKTTIPARARKRKKAAPVPGTKLPAAAGLVTLPAAAFPGRPIHVVADAACHGPALKHLPPAVTWTCRLRANAVLYDLVPPRTPGRTVPFALLTCTLIIWYTRHGHHRAGITARHHAQPWYHAKTEPAFEDMLTQLRRVLITAAFPRVPPPSPHPSKPKPSWQPGTRQPHNCERPDTPGREIGTND